MAKKSAKPVINLSLADPNSTPVEDLAKMEGGTKEKPSLVKSILNMLNGPQDSIERLAFEIDPSVRNEYQSLYYAKTRLIPDDVLKRIAIQDDLVAAIVNARSNQMSAFGRPQADRFSTGFVIEPKSGILEEMNEQQKKELQDRIEKAMEKLSTCGENKGWKDQEKMTFAQFLHMSTRNALVVGRIATEIIWTTGTDGRKKFHSFRPIDAGTIYRAAPHSTSAESVRKTAKTLLEQVKNKKLIPEKFIDGEYPWVQVIDGKPMQAFFADECLVHNFYPVTDIELGGYPLTPLDTVISAVTMHINITTHNKLYFQSGRATRGMLVIKSEDVDETVIGRIRQQFNASINNVNNSWRMPVFGIGEKDDVSFQAFDGGGQKDMEYQYLSDSNARVLLSAFQMSPEELPGYAHLSRGTNNQALSESNNEYKLEAHRDVGIRPMIAQFQDFLNESILPLIDEELSKMCTLSLVGLDADTAEKESVRLQQDMPVHMTMDEVLEKVEKKPLGLQKGGQFPLNQQWQAIAEKYLTFGEMQELFFGKQGASQDPRNQFYQNEAWFKWQEMQMQQQQMQAQAQAAAAGGGDPNDPNGGGGGQGGDEGGDQGGSPQDQGAQADDQSNKQAVAGENQEKSAGGGEFTSAVDQLAGALGKSEKQLPKGHKKLLVQHQTTVKKFMKAFEDEAKEVIEDILDIAEAHGPKDE